MKNGRCRMHGGKSLAGVLSPRYKHGRFTKEAIAQRRFVNELLRECRRELQGFQRAG